VLLGGNQLTKKHERIRAVKDGKEGWKALLGEAGRNVDQQAEVQKKPAQTGEGKI